MARRSVEWTSRLLALAVLVSAVEAALGRSKAGATAPMGRMRLFDAGGEEVVDGGVGDGETVGLDERARLGGDVVELGLEVGGVRHLVTSLDAAWGGGERG